MQITANNVTVIQLSSLCLGAADMDTSQALNLHPGTLLPDLCDALQSSLSHPLSEDLALALLLSAASAGVPVAMPTQTNDATVRNQVKHLCCQCATKSQKVCQ